MLIQVIISIFVIFALSRVVIRYTKKDIKQAEFVSWLVFWVLAIVAVWVPDFLTHLANLVGIGRGADLVLYVSVVIVFYFIFRIILRLEKIERNITKLTRQKAISEAVKKEVEE